MTDITSSQAYIQTEETQYRSAISEALMQKIGGAINFLNDETDALNTLSASPVISHGSQTINSGTGGLVISTLGTYEFALARVTDKNNGLGNMPIVISGGIINYTGGLNELGVGTIYFGTPGDSLTFSSSFNMAEAGQSISFEWLRVKIRSS